jgi:hypothetical protein
MNTVSAKHRETEMCDRHVGLILAHKDMAGEDTRGDLDLETSRLHVDVPDEDFSHAACLTRGAGSCTTALDHPVEQRR